MRAIIVTGATSGIGFEICRQLAALGYLVLGIGSQPESCQRAKDNLASENLPVQPVFLAADLVQQHEVLRVSSELSDLLDQSGCGLHALISNAGCVRSWYATSDEGYEHQFALNHLAGFLLTHQLLPRLSASGGRVLLTGSGSHQGARINWDDVMFSRRYYPLQAYKQSKLCNLLFALEFNNRYHSTGLGACVVDPGLVKTDIGNKQTGFLVDTVWRLRKHLGQDPAVPAKTYIDLCNHTLIPSELYWHNSTPRPYSRAVRADIAQQLFEMSEMLCGIRYPATTA